MGEGDAVPIGEGRRFLVAACFCFFIKTKEAKEKCKKPFEYFSQLCCIQQFFTFLKQNSSWRDSNQNVLDILYILNVSIKNYF
jgi:hypothetical protein